MKPSGSWILTLRRRAGDGHYSKPPIVNLSEA